MINFKALALTAVVLGATITAGVNLKTNNDVSAVTICPATQNFMHEGWETNKKAMEFLQENRGRIFTQSDRAQNGDYSDVTVVDSCGQVHTVYMDSSSAYVQFTGRINVPMEMYGSEYTFLFENGKLSLSGGAAWTQVSLSTLK